MQQTPKYHRNTYSRGVLTSLSYEAPIQPALMDSAEIFSSESVESQSPPRKSATPLHELRLNRPAHQPQEWLQHVLSRRTIHPRWDLDAHCVPSAVPVDWLTHTTLPLSLLFFFWPEACLYSFNICSAVFILNASIVRLFQGKCVRSAQTTRPD